MNSRTRWTKEEETAISEGVKRYASNWGKIKEEYGPNGNGVLNSRIDGTKIATKARDMARKRYESGEDIGHFKCILTDSLKKEKTKITHPKKEKKNKEEWTEEQDILLLKGYELYKNDYKRIVEENPILENHYNYNKMRLRDRIASLQINAIREGNVPKMLVPGKEMLINKEYYAKNKMYISCPDCKRNIDEKFLLEEGLKCECGIEGRVLGKSLKKYGEVVYIISEKDKTLTDEVEYVGITDDIFKRLYMHKKWMSEKEWTIRISLRLSERRAIRIFKPKRNSEKLASCAKSYTFRINQKDIIWEEEDEILLRDKYSDIKYSASKAKIYCRESINTAGIIEGHLMDIDESWCYLIDTEECECDIPCKIRGIWNNFKNLPKYYPLDEKYTKIKSGVKYERNIDYSIGLPCERTERFIIEAVQRNKSIGDSTKRLYAENMRMLSRNKILDEYMYPEEFIIKLKQRYNDGTLSGLLTIINILMMNCKPEEKEILFGKEWRRYRDIYISISKIERERLNKISDTQTKTEREIKNWIEYPELIKLVDEYYKDIPKKESDEYQKYMLIQLHLRQASIRNDYRTVKLFDYNVETDNYIDWEEGIFVFNKYKNVKSLGRITSKIRDEILPIISNIREIRKSQKCNMLVYLKDGEEYREMTSNGYSSLLKRKLETITGKTIGSQMLRKIVVSYTRRGEMPYIESKEFSQKMMHSEGVSKRTYRKL